MYKSRGEYLNKEKSISLARTEILIPMCLLSYSFRYLTKISSSLNSIRSITSGSLSHSTYKSVKLNGETF